VAEQIRLPVPIDPADFKDAYTDAIRVVQPEWEPDRAGILSQALEAGAQIGAQLGELAQDVATDIELSIGQRLDGIQPLTAIASTVTATWTAEDTNGHVLPAGSAAGIDVGGGQLVQFQTVVDYTLGAGSATLAGVEMTATEAGTGADGLTGAGVVVDAPQEWTAVTFTGVSGGGEDAETIEEYEARYGRARRLRAPRPITADDYPEFLRASINGVARAAVLNGYDPVTNDYGDGYDPDDNTTWEKLKVTLSAVDEDGEAITGSTLAAADALFNGDTSTGVRGVREVNWKVNFAAPHYTAVGVHATLLLWEGSDPTFAQASAEEAIAEFLSPAVFGQPSSNDEIGWDVELVVRQAALYGVLQSITGVKAVTALTLGLDGGALADADYTLPVTDAEPIPLPRPGADIVVTVA
jgi:hypothetical protein